MRESDSYNWSWEKFYRVEEEARDKAFNRKLNCKHEGNKFLNTLNLLVCSDCWSILVNTTLPTDGVVNDEEEN